MTHEQLLTFPIYEKACRPSQAMCRQLVKHIEDRYHLHPVPSTGRDMRWNPNFALVQTLGMRGPILTVTLSGKQSRYDGLDLNGLLKSPWKGITRLVATDPEKMQRLLVAVEWSHNIKMELLAPKK